MTQAQRRKHRGTVTDGVIQIADAGKDQLDHFQLMEQAEDSRSFIIPYSKEKHGQEFNRGNVLYKSVSNDQNELVGFIILLLDGDGHSVELRRIVIADKGKTYGSRAMRLIERVVRDELERDRIWLDVYEFNRRAQHVYENSGYRLTGTTEFEGQILKLYEKFI